MRWIEPERRQHRQDLVAEITLQPAPLFGRPLLAHDKPDAFALKLRQQHVFPAIVLHAHQFQRARADAIEHLGGTQAIGASDCITEDEMLTQDGDAHFEKFVEIAIRNA